MAEEAKQPISEESARPSVGSSWYHRQIVAPKIVTPVLEKKHKDPVVYDPLHRNPAYAGGEKAVFVELYALSRHFHPTVSLFAKKILKGMIKHMYGLKKKNKDENWTCNSSICFRRENKLHW